MCTHAYVCMHHECRYTFVPLERSRRPSPQRRGRVSGGGGVVSTGLGVVGGGRRLGGTKQDAGKMAHGDTDEPGPVNPPGSDLPISGGTNIGKEDIMLEAL